MKKFLKVVTSAVLSVALLTACGSTTAPKSSESKASSAASKTSSAQTSSAASNATEEEGLKIAIVSSPSGVDDGSFNQDIYNGILAFIGNHANAKVTPVREESGDTAAAIQAVADIVADYDSSLQESEVWHRIMQTPNSSWWIPTQQMLKVRK